MAKLTTQLKRARAELDHLERQLAKLEARTAGKRTEVARLEGAIADAAERDGSATGPAAVVPAAPAAAVPPAPAPAPVPAPAPAATAPPATVSQVLPSRRTDAVVELLRRATAPMSPSEITGALHDHGRDDELRSVTATLAHLLKAKLVQRVGRGRYVAS